MEMLNDVAGRFDISGRASKGAALGWLDLRLSMLAMKPTQRGRVATIVAELVDNVIKYGGGRGWLSLEGKDSLLVIRVQDFGPGIEDVERALQDHFSSKGTLGLRLPGVKRLADDLEIVSAPGAGTLVSATVSL